MSHCSRRVRVCFNSRSREGSDLTQLNMPNPPLYVSIHAPARGATFGITRIVFESWVSIHAPARGATRHLPNSSLPQESFNSRSREGSDVRHNHGNNDRKSFNSRSREGSDG